MKKGRNVKQVCVEHEEGRLLTVKNEVCESCKLDFIGSLKVRDVKSVVITASVFEKPNQRMTGD